MLWKVRGRGSGWREVIFNRKTSRWGYDTAEARFPLSLKGVYLLRGSIPSQANCGQRKPCVSESSSDAAVLSWTRQARAEFPGGRAGGDGVQAARFSGEGGPRQGSTEGDAAGTWKLRADGAPEANGGCHGDRAPPLLTRCQQVRDALSP